MLLYLVFVSGGPTWTPPSSAARGAAGSPSWLAPPRTRASSPPAPCAEPPGFSSSARDAAEAAGMAEDGFSTSTTWSNNSCS